jgi:hypothetical protein
MRKEAHALESGLIGLNNVAARRRKPNEAHATHRRSDIAALIAR